MVNGMRCPECNADKLMKFGKRWARRGGKRVKVQQYQCCKCGRITVNPIKEEK